MKKNHFNNNQPTNHQQNYKQIQNIKNPGIENKKCKEEKKSTDKYRRQTTKTYYYYYYYKRENVKHVNIIRNIVS